MRSGDAPAAADVMRIRITLELSRSDDPLLFDALVALKKGRRRVARLRTLAHDGLMAARLPAASPSDGAKGPSDSDPLEPDGEHDELAPLDPRVTGGLFDVPLAE